MGIFAGFDSILTEVLLALLPMILVAVVTHFSMLHLSPGERRKITVGFILTFVGLALFLQGVNVGFYPVGRTIGETLASHPSAWLLIPLGLVLGTIVALAEPSVLVMSDTVDRVSSGSIPPKLFLPTVAGAVGLIVALAMAKVLYGIPLLAILIPGYVVAFLLLQKAPPAFTGIAFDGGGVATGPVTSTFILAISLGAAEVLPGRDVVSDGFGLVALVFLAPVLSLAILGVLAGRQQREQQLSESDEAQPEPPAENEG